MQDPTNSLPDRKSSRSRTVAALTFLALCNLVTFNRHYSGKATFPWDFLGGYHAQAYGWYDTGSIFAPVAWFSWTNLGFPGFLSIQSGGWYLPLAILSALGIEYTVPVAAAVQALHVFWAALGMYLLLRQFDVPIYAACAGAIAYHFSAAFFSNQQHVDIVRAAAWLPWLLWAFAPTQLHRKFGAPAAALILSQFFVSAYPGAIVSFAYLMTLWVGLLAYRERLDSSVPRYVFMAGLSALAGLLLSMPKWAPFILNGNAGLEREVFDVPAVDLITLYTFVTPYLPDLIPGDPTMRAFWLPLPILWGVVFFRMQDSASRIGLSIAALGLFFCLAVPRILWLAHFLPGIGVSRFPVADWRPVIHVGLIIAGSVGISRLIDGFFQPRAIAARVGLASLAITWVIMLAIQRGFSAQETVLLVLMQTLLVVFGLCATVSSHLPARLLRFVAPCILFLTAFNGYRYHAEQRLTWRAHWNETTEGQSFGGRMEDFTSAKHPPPQRRPARFLYGDNIPDAVALRDSGFYNRCWYSRSYCVFGYDNLRLSRSHAQLMAAVVGPEGGALMEFIQRPHQLFMALPDEDDVVAPLGRDTVKASAVGNAEGVEVVYRQYAGSEVTYDVFMPAPRRVIENEIGWPGWEVTLCQQERCDPPLRAGTTSQGLRTFLLPAGNWTVRQRYVAPPLWPGYALALLGCLLALAAATLVRLGTRRANWHREARSVGEV